jgi:hypothetical protein
MAILKVTVIVGSAAALLLASSMLKPETVLRLMPTAETYEQWLERLRELAAERELSWMISDSGESHRSAFEAGRSAEEEFASLADLSEWRGCGCGGGS